MSAQSSKSGILVLGAGELGTAVLEALASHPSRNATPIAVLLRPSSITSQDPSKRSLNDKLKGLGISPVPGDIGHDSADTLAATFANYNTILSCAGFGMPSGTQLKITQAALQARVPRFFPWQFGVDYDVVGAGSAQDLFDEQLEVRALLRAQTETDWVIVSVGVFTSFLLQPAFGMVDIPKRTVRAVGGWDREITATTAEDIARVVAEIVFVPGDVARQVVYIAGDTVTYEKLAQLVETRVGEKFEREELGLDHLKGRLEKDPGDLMAKYLSVWARGKGVSWPVEGTWNYERGMNLTDLETYLREDATIA